MKDATEHPATVRTASVMKLFSQNASEAKVEKLSSKWKKKKCFKVTEHMEAASRTFLYQLALHPLFLPYRRLHSKKQQTTYTRTFNLRSVAGE